MSDLFLLSQLIRMFLLAMRAISNSRGAYSIGCRIRVLFIKRWSKTTIFTFSFGKKPAALGNKLATTNSLVTATQCSPTTNRPYKNCQPLFG